MTLTVADIASLAFDGLAQGISGVVHAATLDNGTEYTGRMVLTGGAPSGGLPMCKAHDRVQPAVLEGFSVVAQPGDTVAAGGVTYYVVASRDVAAAGGAVEARVIAAGDMLWQAATFQRETQTTDSAGGFTSSWATLASVTVGIVAMSGAERFFGGQVEETARLQVMVPYVSGLTSKDRLLIGSTAYAIGYVDDFESRGKWHVVDLQGGVAT